MTALSSQALPRRWRSLPAVQANGIEVVAVAVGGQELEQSRRPARRLL